MGFAWLGRVPGRMKGIPMKQRKWLNRVAAMAAAAATLLTEGLVADTALAAETGLAHAKTVTPRCGDGHDSVAFRGLRLVEPVFAQIVRTLRHGMPHVQQSVVEVDVPELQSADLSDAQPAHQQREMDRQAVVFREALDQRVDLLPGHRRLLASFGRSLPRDEVAWIRGQ